MPSTSTALLSPAAIEQIQRLAKAARDAEVAPLIGTGLSVRRGLPRWGDLVDNLILAWREKDTSSSKQNLDPKEYVKLIRRNFKSDLAVVSYLRHRIDEYDRTYGKFTFGDLLYSALYSYKQDASSKPSLFTPTPSDIHRHIVALFRQYPGRIWTTNYDDLFEEAASSMGIRAIPLDPASRYARKALLVAHLHGFLAPQARLASYPNPTNVQPTLALAEDDYHIIASEPMSWTNREFHSLFDQYSVLMLGMSLEDPNIRRVLASNKNRQGSSSQPHFAVLRTLSRKDVGKSKDLEGLEGLSAGVLKEAAEDSNQFRTWYWQQHGVEVILLPDHESVLPFLLRLRYESSGSKPGELWAKGAALGYNAARAENESQQEFARFLLNRACDELRKDFALNDAELVSMGILLLKPDPGDAKSASMLRLAFRTGDVSTAMSSAREFSANPDAPTGLAGRVVTLGTLEKAAISDPLFDWGLPDAERASNPNYAAIIASPIIDWSKQGQGTPLGVIYVSLATTKGVLFNLPEQVPPDSSEKSMEDLYLSLNKIAMLIINKLRKRV